LSVLTGLTFGLIPAINGTRPNLTHSIGQRGLGTSGGRSHQRVRSLLVISEIALALVLLMGAGLLIRSFFAFRRIDTGFNSTNVITAGLPTSVKRFPTAARLNLYLDRIADRIDALPGVRDVALASSLPMRGWSYGAQFQIVGRTVVDPANRSICFFKMISPSYFRTLGMRLERGRLLGDHDVKGSPPVAVINETMARKYFPGEDPVGKRLLIQEILYGKMQLGPDIPWEVVGVVADEKVRALTDRSEYSGVYVTNEQSPQTIQSLIVRTSRDPLPLQQEIQRVVHEIDKDQALPEMMTLEEIKSDSMGNDRLRSMLLGIFAGIALLLSAVGLYGVISYSVVQRTREIGIRAALGADSGKIVGLILRNGMMLVGIGLALGIVGALALSRLLSSLLFGIGERDPITLAAVAGILACVALAACYIPAKRASKVDPIAALRCE
jgi:putative ABC transport system permease protein